MIRIRGGNCQEMKGIIEGRWRGGDGEEEMERRRWRGGDGMGDRSTVRQRTNRK